MNRIDKIIFHNARAIPEKIKREYIKRWDKIKHPSLNEFILCCFEHNKGAGDWYLDSRDIEDYYENYILGVVGKRYPVGLLRPEKVLNDVADEANEQIKF